MTGAWTEHRLVRRFMRQDKGSIILEGVVSLGIIAVLTLGYTNVSTSATISQRTAVNESIAVQAAQDALEKAKATSWSDVGTDVASTSIVLPSGVEEIIGGVLPANPASVEVRGLPITVRTAVGWQKKPSGPSDFGTKLVMVEVSWQDVQGDSTTAHMKPQQILITPGIGEAVPAGIRGSTEVAPTPSATPTPTSTPTPTPTPTPPPAPAPLPVSPFIDVPVTHAFYDEIVWMYNEGISTGWSEANGTRTYRPAEGTSRDQMAAFIYRQFKSPAFSAPTASPFVDLTPSSPLYKEITYLDSKGVLPWDGSTFGAASKVNREEMAVLMYRMAGRPAYTPPATTPFIDVPVTDDHYKEMAWMKSTGISTGWADGSYRPGIAVSREQMAAFFYRYNARFGNAIPGTYSDIEKKYDVVNGPVLLGAAAGPETTGLVKGGAYRCYANGCISWSPTHGAYVSLSGPIRTAWGSYGFESGWLGYPTNDGTTGLKNGGASQNFEGAKIVWSQASGARTVHGAIGGYWAMANSQDGWLGYPTTDEIAIKNGGAKQNYQGGYIYWNPSIGAAYVMGAIGNTWISQGAENSKFGYPTSSEYAWNGMQRQDFENGYITWTSTGGVVLH